MAQREEIKGGANKTSVTWSWHGSFSWKKLNKVLISDIDHSVGKDGFDSTTLRYILLYGLVQKIYILLYGIFF